MRLTHKSKIFFLLLFVVSQIEAETLVPDQKLPTAELQLSPRLCIRGTSDEVCEITVLIEWDGESAGKYCLYREQLEAPLKCWEQEKVGSINDRVKIQQNLEYWLVWAAVDELDRRVLRLLTAKPDDRRKSRRRRHAWSVF